MSTPTNLNSGDDVAAAKLVRSGEPRSGIFAKAVTLASCGVAVVLAVLQHFIGPDQYDPSVAIGTLAFIGAAILTYVASDTLLTQQAQLLYQRIHDQEVLRLTDINRREDLRGKKARLATLVLAEASFLTSRLAKVNEFGGESYHDPFGHPAMNEAMRHFAILDPTTCQRLAAVVVRLTDVQLAMETRREARREVRDTISRRDADSDQGRYVGPPASVIAAHDRIREMDRFIQFQAAWAYNRIPALVSALKELEGGTMPPVEQEQPSEGNDPPALLPDPFPRRPEI